MSRLKTRGRTRDLNATGSLHQPRLAQPRLFPSVLSPSTEEGWGTHLQASPGTLTQLGGLRSDPRPGRCPYPQAGAPKPPLAPTGSRAGPPVA